MPTGSIRTEWLKYKKEIKLINISLPTKVPLKPSDIFILKKDILKELELFHFGTFYRFCSISNM